MEVKLGSKRTKMLAKFKAKKKKFLVSLKGFTILDKNNNENK
jgi:hypothetical protein